jgi:uncharacterized membrane protein (UPF0127 family)
MGILARRTAILLSLFACTVGTPMSTDAQSAAPKPSPDGGTGLPRGRVVLQDAFGGAHVVEVEVASTDATRAQGLMWREHLAPGQGMLFIFPIEEEHSFWMKNTLIPLDMIFITRDGKIVGIVEQATPRTLDPRTVGKPSTYVLEVPGGYSQKIGLRPGSKVELHGLAMVRAR